MRILQLAPLWENVPPPAYGGTEAVVHDLTEGLMAVGHDVTLFATGHSRTSARHLSVYDRPLRSESQLKEKAPYEYVHAASALAEAAQDYDVIHNHAGGLPIAFAGLIDTPMLSTKHCLVEPDWEFVWRRYRGYYNTISRRAYACLPDSLGGTYVGHVYNGIDVESFPYNATKDDYLLFLSRIAPEKAPHLAIEAALKSGTRIVIAGKVDPNPRDEQYFDEVIKPLIDGRRVEWFGEADAVQKRDLYRNARALLLPIVWEEPFGLVMVEAMACGTPAIVFRRGAAPEVVADGVSGFLVDDVDGMVDAISRLDELSAAACRRHAFESFDTSVMVNSYIEVYTEILDRENKETAAAVDRLMRDSAPETARWRGR
ncbi:MAG TPA: glycosyltransferase family 4 protein [Dehalococcoidia bacterium]|nr:glycosyltransferase family 4 protein [Dehalococcoidia bacterium]